VPWLQDRSFSAACKAATFSTGIEQFPHRIAQRFWKLNHRLLTQARQRPRKLSGELAMPL
jgi:hypothetical protein